MFTKVVAVIAVVASLGVVGAAYYHGFSCCPLFGCSASTSGPSLCPGDSCCEADEVTAAAGDLNAKACTGDKCCEAECKEKIAADGVCPKCAEEKAIAGAKPTETKPDGKTEEK